MWTSLEPIWQEAFALAWNAFCAGTVPVGCVIVDHHGEIVARGQNAIFDSSSSSPLAGTNLAHAEMIALSQLKKNEHPEIKGYSLCTTLEPCPMCFGAAVMMGIRQIHYAGRDGIAGSIDLTTATSYLSSKKIKTELADPILEVFQLALVTAFEWRRNHPRQEKLLDLLRADCPKGVAIGTELFEQGYFARAVQEGYWVGQVFREVVRYFPTTPQERLP